MFHLDEPEDSFDPSQTSIVQSAAALLKNYFFNVRDDPIRTPYFLKQLQVLYETDYYPWVVSDALKLLESQEIIRSFTGANLKDMTKLKHLSRIKFFVNSMIANNVVEFERIKTRAYNICMIINEYCHPEITSNVGSHLQTLVWSELSTRLQNSWRKYQRV